MNPTHIQQQPHAPKHIQAHDTLPPSPSASASSSLTIDGGHVPHHAFSSHIQVLGPRGLYFPHDVGFFTRFWHLFPDSKSRIAAGIILVGAIAAIIAWAVVTIEQKWIQPHRTPITSLTIETVDRLPAAHGMLSYFHDDTWWNGTIADTLDLTYYDTPPVNTPFPNYTLPGPIPPHRYTFQTAHMLGMFQQVVNQTLIDSVYGCFVNAMKGLQLTPVMWCLVPNYPEMIEKRIEWPLQYDNTQAQFCVRTYALFDTRATLSVILDSAKSYSINFNEVTRRHTGRTHSYTDPIEYNADSLVSPPTLFSFSCVVSLWSPSVSFRCCRPRGCI